MSITSERLNAIGNMSGSKAGLAIVRFQTLIKCEAMIPNYRQNFVGKKRISGKFRGANIFVDQVVTLVHLTKKERKKRRHGDGDSNAGDWNFFL